MIHLRRGWPYDDHTICGIYRNYWQWNNVYEHNVMRSGPQDWVWSREYLSSPIEHACPHCIDAFKGIMLKKLTSVEL